MTTRVITIILVLVGLINLYPVTGALSAERLQALYGIAIRDDNLLILMRHRAILFGMLGAFIIYAGFRPALQPLAFLAGFISMLTFIGLTLATGDYNVLLRKVVIADVVASLALLVACILFFRR
ncbi:MAG: phosphopantetheine adenylyltransferase [Terriglobia bacterium]